MQNTGGGGRGPQGYRPGTSLTEQTGSIPDTFPCLTSEKQGGGVRTIVNWNSLCALDDRGHAEDDMRPMELARDAKTP